MKKRDSHFILGLKYTVAYLGLFTPLGGIYLSCTLMYQQWKVAKLNSQLSALVREHVIETGVALIPPRKVPVPYRHISSDLGLAAKFILITILITLPINLLFWPFALVFGTIPSLFSSKKRSDAGMQSYFQLFGISPSVPQAFTETTPLPQVSVQAFDELIQRLNTTLRNEHLFSGEHSQEYTQRLAYSQSEATLQTFLQYLIENRDNLIRQLHLGKSSFTPVRISKEQSNLPYTLQITLIEGELALIADVKSKTLLGQKLHNAFKAMGLFKTVKKSLRLDKIQVLANLVNETLELGTYDSPDKKTTTLVCQASPPSISIETAYQNAYEVSTILQNSPGVTPVYQGAVYSDRKVPSQKRSYYMPFIEYSFTEYLLKLNTESEKGAIAVSLISAIASFHHQNLILSDLKMDNIRVNNEGEVFILDHDGVCQENMPIPQNVLLTPYCLSPEMLAVLFNDRPSYIMTRSLQQIDADLIRIQLGHISKKTQDRFIDTLERAKKGEFQSIKTCQKSTDIWALGCILEEIFGENPSNEIQAILDRCFDENPDTRITIDELSNQIQALQVRTPSPVPTV